MTGFADLPEKAQPTLGKYPAKATAGTNWEFVAAGPDFLDANDTPVDLSGTTGVCVLVDDDGNQLATFNYQGRVGEVVVSLPKATTAGLASGAERRCRWSLVISNGAVTVQVWGRAESPFYVRAS